jgi:hypothetical protein
MSGIKKQLQSVFPMSSESVVQQFPKFLLEYEKTELLEYKTVYYLDVTKEKRPIKKNEQ